MSHYDLDTLYRQVILDHYKHPRNRGTFTDEAVQIDMNNPTCGDRIQLQLKLNGNVIEDVRFTGEGCSISMASASMMTQAIKGKELTKALQMAAAFSKMMLGEEVDIEVFGVDDIEALKGVANFPARIKCATLAWKAVEKAQNQIKQAD